MQFLKLYLRYPALIKIKVKEAKAIGVKRQLVFLCYHSGNQSDENEDMKLIIVFSRRYYFHER